MPKNAVINDINSELINVYCDELDNKNIKFLLSNSSTDFIIDLYSYYNIEFIEAKRFINSDVNKRGNIQEILVSNYD